MTPQFTLYSHAGPNSLKVDILLEKLGLSYEVVPLQMSDDAEVGVKGITYLSINPNGRVPALVDHFANDFVVWESGAILLYLVDAYDKEGKFAGTTPQERAITSQWLTYQLSGLGPVQGNLNYVYIYWEATYGEKPNDSVRSRFHQESHRLYKVLDDQLAFQSQRGSPWITLNRPTLADFAYYPWIRISEYAKLDLSQYKHVLKWRDTIAADEEVVKAVAKHPTK